MFVLLLAPVFAWVGIAAPLAALAQSAGVPTDLASFLVLMAGPGASIAAAFILNKFQWFNVLSSGGKLTTVAVLTAMFALLAVGAQQLLVAQPFLGPQIDPYVKGVLFAFSFLSSQAAYGAREARKSKTMRAEFDAWLRDEMGKIRPYADAEPKQASG
jgi:hypothetical protein